MRISEIVETCARHATSHLASISADGSEQRVSFPVLAAAARDLADRLRAAGLRPGQVIGLHAENGIAWVVWDLAAIEAGAVIRAYPTTSTFCALDRIETDDLALLVTDRGVGAHIAPLSPEAFEPAMLRLQAPADPRRDLHSIVYSSGTTGREKRLMISREGASAALSWVQKTFEIGPDDRHIVFLPLPNFQQRQQVYICLLTGADVTLCDYQQVMRVMRRVKPTFLLAPPALYDNMLSVAEATGGVASLAGLFGGAIRFMITGMAPIRRHVVEAYAQAKMPLLEGYGLTEGGIIACNTLDGNRLGTVGRLIDPACFSIAETGEVLIRQTHPLSLGYLGDDDLNAATFSADGAIRTGDLGRLDDEGYLTLVGRLKDLIILPSGRKLHPGDLEQALLQVEGVSDAVVVDHGSAITAVLNVSEGVSEGAIRADLRLQEGAIDASGAINRMVFTDLPLSTNPIFNTANMKLNRALVRRHFLGD